MATYVQVDRDSDPRRSGRSVFTRSYLNKYEYSKDFLNITLTLTIIWAAAYCTCIGLLFSERKFDKIDTHYWLEGDNSVNGDSYHNVNFAAGALFGVIGVFVASLGIYLLRATDFHFKSTAGSNSKKIGADTSNHTNNAITHGPISVAEALILVAFMQGTGTSDVWAMAYAAVLSLFGDWLSVAVRVVWLNGKRAGSSVFSIFCYVIIKLTPLLWIAVAGARNSMSDTMTAAWWIFFGFACLRIVIIAGAYLAAMMSPGAQFYKKLFMQPDLKQFAAAVATGKGISTIEEARNKMPRHNWRPFWAVIAGVNVVCFALFVAQTMTAFGMSNNVGRRVFGRITWTKVTRWNDAPVAELDRTWPVLQVAVPLQFGLLMLFTLYQVIAWKQTLTLWSVAADYMNDFAFAIADFWAVWVVLNLTGTTELSNLLFAGVVILACNAMITEARRQYPWYFSVVPSLVGLLPFIHSSINLATMVHHNDIELIGVIIFFSAYAVRTIVYFFLRFRGDKDNTYYYFDKHPGTYVIARFLTNWCVRFCVLAVWWGGGFHHGWQVVNDK